MSGQPCNRLVRQRVVALWFPDWPIQAARIEAAGKLDGPVVVVRQHRVQVCSAEARAAGVRRGMKIRQAQAICPGVAVLESNPDRDGVVFAEIAGSLDEVASSVEVMRPGLVIADAAAAGRFHGSEDRAVEMLLDATARQGVDACVGVADEIATALIAARHPGGGMVVAPGESRSYLSGMPVGILSAEVALGCEPAVIDKLGVLGVRTLGELTELPLPQIVTRFGEAGRLCHSVARAAQDRRVAPELPVSDLAVSFAPEEPIERVDTAAFAARQLAARLHHRLAAAGVVCLRLRISAELASGKTVERMWRTRSALTEEATADRVRWQLDGWLTRARAADADGAGITELILDPLETAAPEMVGQLWGTGATEDQARRVISRVQSQLGVDRVLQPRPAGGRGVAERIELVPYGEERDPVSEGSWPGRIPSPLPARLGGGATHPSARVRLIDAAAKDVYVTAEALLSSVPYALGWGKQRYRVAAWAGPWPVDTFWWNDKGEKVARLQVVGQAEKESHQRAWLLLWSQGQWRVEAAYE